MLGAAPIFPNLNDGPSWARAPTVVGEHQFQQALMQAAPTQDVASPAADRGVFTPPPASEIQRATADATPLGERILQTLSMTYRSNTVVSPVVRSAEVLPKEVAPGPAEWPLSQSGGVRASIADKPVVVDTFEPMMADLRDVYNSVIRVSLVSKSTSSVSSSLNKLLSAG
ncbi:nodulation protein NolB [Bradyrhizobium centrolobii]|nr:nodulation protein NolB [Bradyrhizobium centrolobii]